MNDEPLTLRLFYDVLDAEEERLAQAVRRDTLGLIMRIALNEFDLDFYLTRQKKQITDRDRERSYLMRIGVARLMKIALDTHAEFEAPTLTMRRTANVSLPVLQLIEGFGIVEHGRRVAQSIEAGMATITKTSNRFEVSLAANLSDLEFHENTVSTFYQSEARHQFNERITTTFTDEYLSQVSSLLYDLVYPYREHFIGYEADPKLDVTFFGLAYHEISISKEYDNFHFNTQFGGVRYQVYKLAATFLLSIAMRHERFAEALVTKEPHIRLENVLTVSVETEPLLESMVDAINYFGCGYESHTDITLKDARTIFKVMSVNRQNTKLLDRPGGPFPPLVQCSDRHVIRPIFGARSDIMLFLLNSLQHHFPTDYDRAQRQRERAMQLGAKRILRQTIGEVEFRDNILIKKKGTANTDMDLVVIEPSSGIVVICQLKHQDPYGADIAAMRTRTSRLKYQGDRWLKTVRSWLEQTDEKTVRATLRIPKSVTISAIKLLVLTRHFAFVFRDVVVGDGEQYSNWNQFVHAARLTIESRAAKAGLADFLTELRLVTQPPTDAAFINEHRTEWNVGELAFSVTHASAEPPA